MREYLDISGGVRLEGAVPISGAKNAALPLLIASLLTAEECVFFRVPNLEDTGLTLRLLEHFGAETSFRSAKESSINTGSLPVMYFDFGS